MTSASVFATVGIAHGPACDRTDGTGDDGSRDSTDGRSPISGAAGGTGSERQSDGGGKQEKDG